MKAEPMRTKGKRRIEMTTAEWIGRLVTEIPFEDRKGCGPIIKIRKEEEIISAVEWARLKAIRLICPEKKELHNRLVITVYDLEEAFYDVLKKKKAVIKPENTKQEAE